MMMPIQDAAIDTLPRILEGAAFLFSDPIPSGEQPDLDGWEASGVAVVWKGPSAGSMHLWASEAFRRILAANMLGVDESDPNVDVRSMDALKELLNMVAGNSLTEAYGSEPVFHLGIPSLLDGEQLPMDQSEGGWFLVEDHPILIVARQFP